MRRLLTGGVLQNTNNCICNSNHELNLGVVIIFKQFNSLSLITSFACSHVTNLISSLFGEMQASGAESFNLITTHISRSLLETRSSRACQQNVQTIRQPAS